MNNKDQLENLFRKRFEDQENPVSERVWENIKKSLPPEPPATTEPIQPGIFFFGLLLIGVAFTAMTYFFVEYKISSTTSSVAYSTQNNPRDREKTTSVITDGSIVNKEVKNLLQASNSNPEISKVRLEKSTYINSIREKAGSEVSTVALAVFNLAKLKPQVIVPASPDSYNTITVSASDVKNESKFSSISGQEEKPGSESHDTETIKDHSVIIAINNVTGKDSINYSVSEDKVTLANKWKPRLNQTIHSDKDIKYSTHSSDTIDESALVYNDSQWVSNAGPKLLTIEDETEREEEEIYSSLLQESKNESTKDTKAFTSGNPQSNGNTFAQTDTLTKEDKRIEGIHSEKERKKKKEAKFLAHPFAVDFVFGPQYNFRSIAGDQEIVNDRNESERIKFSFGGGVRFNYGFGENFSLGVGVGFGNYGERYEKSFKSIYNETQYTYGWVIDPSAPVDSLWTITDTTIVQKSKDDLYSKNNYYRYLSIPVTASYTFGQGKAKFILSGGVAANILLKAYTSRFSVVDSSGSKALITELSSGEENPFRKVTFMLVVNPALSYDVSDRCKLLIQPGFSYFVNSVYKDSAPVDLKPYAIDIKIGLRYFLK